MKPETIQALILEAFTARENAYAPYSHYKVGAALLTGSGKLYRGCNVENASYGATSCAERTAVFHAVSEGERVVTAIAIAGGPEAEAGSLSDYAYPCGICRQVLSEFAGEDCAVIVAKSLSEYRIHTLGELLAHSFSLKP